MPKERTLSPVLMTLTTLFVLRVFGQVLVVCDLAPWLPPPAAWHSGLLPYPVLLVGQVLIIVVMVSICRDLFVGTGWFCKPRKRLGIGLLWFGSIYLLCAVLRAVLVVVSPEQFAFLAQWIPIVLHLVLATFTLLVARFNLRRQARGSFVKGGFWQNVRQ